LNNFPSRVFALKDFFGRFADVVVRVGDSSFPCHRAMLCAYSNYFSSLIMPKTGDCFNAVIEVDKV
jgi:hypothetical protein